MLSPIGKILSLIWEMLSLVWAILSPNFGERLSPERGEFQLVSLAPAHHSFSGDRRGGQTKKGGMAPTLSLSLSLSLLIRGVEKGPLARDRVNQTFLPSLSFFPPLLSVSQELMDPGGLWIHYCLVERSRKDKVLRSVPNTLEIIGTTYSMPNKCTTLQQLARVLYNYAFSSDGNSSTKARVVVVVYVVDSKSMVLNNCVLSAPHIEAPL